MSIKSKISDHICLQLYDMSESEKKIVEEFGKSSPCDDEPLTLPSDILKLYRKALDVYSMRYNRLLGFECLVVQSCPRKEVQGAVVYFHGLGANPESFLRVQELYRAMFKTNNVVFIFPQAPFEMDPKELGADPHADEGDKCYKWWDIIDPGWACTKLFSSKLVGKRPEANLQNFSTDSFSGVASIRGPIEMMRQSVSAYFNIKYSNIAVAGFSQGAMLAVDTFFFGSDVPLSVGIFSGAPMCLREWTSAKKSWSPDELVKRKATPIYQCHGRSDNVLPLSVGRVLRKYLRSEGYYTRWGVFPGDHSFPDQGVYTWLCITFARLRKNLLEQYPVQVTNKNKEETSEEKKKKKKNTSRSKCTLENSHRADVDDKLPYNMLMERCDKTFYSYLPKRPFRRHYNGNVISIIDPNFNDAELKYIYENREEYMEQYKMVGSDEEMLETVDSLEEYFTNDKEPKLIQPPIMTQCEPMNLFNSKKFTREEMIAMNKQEELDDNVLSRQVKCAYRFGFGILSCCLPPAGTFLV